jgi:GH18 family chitinase
MKKLLTPFLLILASVSSTPSFAGDPTPVKLGHIQLGTLAFYSTLNHLEASKLTHLSAAFMVPNQKGMCDFIGTNPDDRNAARQSLLALVKFKTRHPGLKLLLTLGGWAGSRYFSPLAKTLVGRKRYSLDGFNIDWEFPADPRAENITTPEDPSTMALLVNEFGIALKARSKNAILMVALGGSASTMGDWYHVRDFKDHVDYVEMMAHSACQTMGCDPAPLGGEDSFKFLEQNGVRPDQILYAIPFFGLTETAKDSGKFEWMSFREAKGLFHLHLDQFDTTRELWNLDEKTGRRFQIEPKWRIREKIRFVLDHHFAGITAWELTQDSENQEMLNSISN